MPDLLALAERVIRARDALAQAEADFKAATNGARGTAAPVVSPTKKQGAKGPTKGPTIVQRVHDLMREGNALTHREILERMGGPDKRWAVRKALQKLRANDKVVLKDGLYAWKKGSK